MSNEHVRYVNLDDVDDYIANTKPAWVECRSDKHNMADHDVKTNEDGCWIVIRRCRRCYTKRHETIDRQGIVLNVEFEYPEGYCMPKGSGRVSAEGRGAFRLARIQNFHKKKVDKIEGRAH